MLLPVVGAVVVALLPRGRGALPKQVALGFSLVTLVVVAVVAIGFDTGSGAARYQFTETHEWIRTFGAHYALGRGRHRPHAGAADRDPHPGGDPGLLERRRRRPLGGGRVLRLDAGAGGSRDRGVLLPRRVLVLRPLRGHAHPDLLPDRRVRGRAPLRRGGEVPAVLALRRAADAGLGGRPVRRVRGLLERADVPALGAEPDPDRPGHGPLAVRRASSSRSRSRPPWCRCTPGCRTPPSRAAPAPRCCWSASWTRSAPSG